MLLGPVRIVPRSPAFASLRGPGVCAKAIDVIAKVATIRETSSFFIRYILLLGSGAIPIVFGNFSRLCAVLIETKATLGSSHYFQRLFKLGTLSWNGTGQC